MEIRRAAATIAAMLAGFATCARAVANDPLWEALKGGGQVILMRHALTTPGVGDPPGMRIDSCPTQRNLPARAQPSA